MTDTIFSIQDETGTVTQVTLMPSPSPVLVAPIKVGDIGIYEGIPDDGTTTETFQSLPFIVSQLLDADQFSVRTENANMADWPANGQIRWTAGSNINETSIVIRIDGANAYIDLDFMRRYHESRGNSIPGTATDTQLRAAIVKSTDYLDQRYRFAGIKLLQKLGNAAAINALVYQSWLQPYSLTSALYLTPSTSKQSTEWPRQGVVDYSGNTINGIPPQIKAACAELALRVLNGVNLQPDYDPGLGGQGSLVKSVTKKIGPLETTIAYDNALAMGFFASFPHIDRLLNKAGLLYVGGGRTVVR